MDVGFRGGAIARIEAQCNITIDAPKYPPIITISNPGPISGTVGQPTQIIDFSVTNNGGQFAICRPYAESTEELDLSWISFSPKEAVVVNNNLPVNFVLTLDWANAPEGNFQISIHSSYSIFSRDWFLVYSSGQIILPI